MPKTVQQELYLFTFRGVGGDDEGSEGLRAYVFYAENLSKAKWIARRVGGEKKSAALFKFGENGLKCVSGPCDIQPFWKELTSSEEEKVGLASIEDVVLPKWFELPRLREIDVSVALSV